MSEALNLSAHVRRDIGKGASRRLRHSGQIPAIIYGGKKEATSILIEERLVKKAMESETFYSQVITLEIDKDKHSVILKDLQRHPAKGNALHLDFQRISASEELTTRVPLHFVNEDTCVGVKAGGSLSHTVNEVDIRCLPKDLPEFIEVDVKALAIGDTIHLTDLQVPANISLVQLLQGGAHDLAVVAVKAPRSKESEETQEAEATPDSSENKTDNKE